MRMVLAYTDLSNEDELSAVTNTTKREQTTKPPMLSVSLSTESRIYSDPSIQIGF